MEWMEEESWDGEERGSVWLLLNELESSMLCCCSESVKTGSKWWGAEVQPTT